MGSTVCSECTQGNPADVSCCIKVVILWLRCAHEFHWHLWMLTIIFQLDQRIRAVPWWLPPTGMSQWWMWGRNCHANYRCQIDLTMNRWKCDGCTLNHVLLACQLILFSTAAIEGNITSVRPDPVHYMLTSVRAKDVQMLLLFCEFFWKEGKELKLYCTLYFVTIFFWLKNLLFFLFPYPSLVADDTMVEWWLSFLFFSLFWVIALILLWLVSGKLPQSTALCDYSGTGLTGLGKHRSHWGTHWSSTPQTPPNNRIKRRNKLTFS